MSKTKVDLCVHSCVCSGAPTIWAVGYRTDDTCGLAGRTGAAVANGVPAGLPAGSVYIVGWGSRDLRIGGTDSCPAERSCSTASLAGAADSAARRCVCGYKHADSRPDGRRGGAGGQRARGVVGGVRLSDDGHEHNRAALVSAPIIFDRKNTVS